MTEKFLTINKYSRSGRPRETTKGIVVHWNEYPRGTAEGLFQYFESLKEGKLNHQKELIYGSTQIGVGYKGDALQFMGLGEVAYHVGASEYTDKAKEICGEQYVSNNPWTPNDVLLGIEMGHEDWEGRHSWETIATTIKIIVPLLKLYGLTSYNVWRHYDITGKECPKFFVTDPEYWDYFRECIRKMQ